MVDKSYDHENDANLQHSTRALLVLTISQQKIKQIPLKIFRVILRTNQPVPLEF